MNKRIVPVILAGLLSVSGCSAVFTRSPQFNEQVTPVNARSGEMPVIPGPQLRLPVYERLTYELKWMGLSVGTLVTTIKGVENINGRDAYVLEAVASTKPFFSHIYKIEDRFVSYMDVEKLYTLRHEVHRSEGRHRKEAVTDFDQVNHKAHYHNITDKSEKDFEIPPDTQDTLTASYYFMLLPMKMGDRLEYAVCNNEKNYRLLAFIGARGRVRLPNSMGEKDGFLVEPFASETEGKMVDKGRVSAYYSWDERRLPLYAVIKAPVLTSVTVALTGVDYAPASEKK
jgi:hypothetical protein